MYLVVNPQFSEYGDLKSRSGEIQLRRYDNLGPPSLYNGESWKPMNKKDGYAANQAEISAESV